VQAQNALNRGQELLIGKNPDMVINNTNAQQTIVEPALRPRLSKEEWIAAFGPKEYVDSTAG